MTSPLVHYHFIKCYAVFCVTYTWNAQILTVCFCHTTSCSLGSSSIFPTQRSRAENDSAALLSVCDALFSHRRSDNHHFWSKLSQELLKKKIHLTPSKSFHMMDCKRRIRQIDFCILQSKKPILLKAIVVGTLSRYVMKTAITELHVLSLLNSVNDK